MAVTLIDRDGAGVAVGLEAARRFRDRLTGFVDGHVVIDCQVHPGHPIGVQHAPGNYVAFLNDADEHEGWYW